MKWLTRVLPSLASLVVGAASFALSFVALSEVAASSGAVPAAMSWLVPVVIDGGIIGGSAVIWANSYQQRRRELFPFAFVTALVAVSVAVNVAHASAGSLLGRVIASLPPLVLLGTLELVAAQHRREAGSRTALAPSAVLPDAAAVAAAQDPAPAAPVAAATAAKPAAKTRASAAKPRAARAARESSTGDPAPTAPARPAGTGTRSTSRKPLRVSAHAPDEAALAAS